MKRGTAARSPTACINNTGKAKKRREEGRQRLPLHPQQLQDSCQGGFSAPQHWRTKSSSLMSNCQRHMNGLTLAGVNGSPNLDQLTEKKERTLRSICVPVKLLHTKGRIEDVIEVEVVPWQCFTEIQHQKQFRKG